MNLVRPFFLMTMVLLSLAPSRISHAIDLFDRPDTAQHVHARLIAETTAVEAGQSFRLGVLLTMDPEWHTYWINGGDVGYATVIDWQLPEGFEAGPLQWPVPERIEQMGLVSYAYTGQVLLFATVTPPEDLPSGQTVSLNAHVTWLACKEVCIPGEQDVSLELPQGESQAPGDAALFDQYAALAPTRSLNEPDEGLSLSVEPGKLPPVLAAPLNVRLKIQAAEGWRIDVGDMAANGLYPIISPDWEGTHPRLTGQDESSLNYEWTLTPFEGSARVGDLAAVLSVNIENTETGESRRVVGTYSFETDAEPAGPTPAEQATPSPVNAMEAGGERIAGVDDVSPGLSFLGERTETHSLAWYLLLALLGGVILNVMPCVLPVVSLKVLSFVKQSGESRARVLQMGVAFTAGVLVSFLALAVVVIGLKLAGAQVGWGFQFQEPRFVIAMSAIVLVFGLSLFGVFEINLPGRTATKMEFASGRGGLAGAFFNGVLATALATPCTAPLMGPALGFAFNQPPALIVLFFLMIGLGLSLPYLLLSMNPAWLRYLPRPGGWMERFKQLMGFLLIATLVWLLWVLGAQIGNDGVARTMAFLLGLALACWLIGLGWDYRSTVRRRWMLTLLAAAIAVGSYAFPANYLAKLNDGAMPARVDAPATANGQGIAWQPFSVERVEDLAAKGRMVFLDFTADWCLTCQFNERTVLETARIRQAFDKYNVEAVKADWTRRDEIIGAVLAQFGRNGVPLYVILPPGNAGEPIMLDTILTPDAVEAGLAQAASLNP